MRLFPAFGALALAWALAFAMPGRAETPAAAAPAEPAGKSAEAERQNERRVESRVRPVLKSLFPNLELLSLRHGALPGIVEAQLSEGVSVYLSPDGKNILVGELYSIGEQGITHVSEQGRKQWRRGLLQEIRDQAIVFTPQNRKARAGVTVFTDVDCGYCRKIHEDVPALNQRGIEVRYLAFPRNGLGTETYRRMVSAWCADDQQRAMTRLKRGASVPIRLCASNPVADHYRLGKRLGITGTPALLTDDGEMAPGYRPPEQIQRLLGLE